MCHANRKESVIVFELSPICLIARDLWYYRPSELCGCFVLPESTKDVQMVLRYVCFDAFYTSWGGLECQF